MHTTQQEGTGLDQSLLLFQDVVMFTIGYVVPALLVFGICGNIFSLIIFIRTRKRSDAPAQYLSCLAISDTGVLLTLGLPYWLHYGLQYVSGGRHYFDIHTYSKSFLQDIHVLMAFYQLRFSMDHCRLLHRESFYCLVSPEEGADHETKKVGHFDNAVSLACIRQRS